jgi:hypothetical protein
MRNIFATITKLSVIASAALDGIVDHSHALEHRRGSFWDETITRADPRFAPRYRDLTYQVVNQYDTHPRRLGRPMSAYLLPVGEPAQGAKRARPRASTAALWSVSLTPNMMLISEEPWLIISTFTPLSDRAAQARAAMPTA